MNNITEKIRELNFPKLESNRDPTTGDLVARMYQAGTSNKNYIVEPDGSHFTGKITSKKFYRKCKSETGREKPGYWQVYRVTSDGRWFDNAGWICDQPKEQKAPENIDE